MLKFLVTPHITPIEFITIATMAGEIVRGRWPNAVAAFFIGFIVQLAVKLYVARTRP